MRRWLGRWFRRTAIVLGLLLFMWSNFLAFAPQGRTIVRSALFVTQVLPIPIKPQEWVTADSTRESISFALPNGEGSADIHRIPDGKKHAGILMFLGVNPAPRDDKRVVNLGTGLARAGFVVMIPWSPVMMDKRLSPDEPDNLVAAFQYLRGLEYVDPDRVGMGGLCVGASVALVAASDPRISDQVDFVSSFGAYYDLRDLLKQIAAKKSFYGDIVEPWDPRRLTEEVFINTLIDSLSDEQERALLSGVFRARTAEPDTLDGLSSEARATSQLLSSMAAQAENERLTLDEAEQLIDLLPDRFLENLDRISPSTNIADLKARLLIAHDREDDAVPSEESRRLEDSLSARGDVHYTEFSFFSHVTPDKPVGPFTFVKEAFKLFQYTYQIIRITT